MRGFFVIRKDRKSRRTTAFYRTESEASIAADKAIENDRFIAVWVTDAESGAVLYHNSAEDGEA